MSKYNKTILTSAGLDLAARASSGKAKFTITRAATSTEKLADKSISELQQLTALPSLMQYGEINNVADSAQDKSIVIGTELIFNNKDLTTGYNVNTIGLFAKEEGTNKELLYALTTAVEPETMPDFKDMVLFKFNLTLFVVVGQKDNVTVNVTENGVVTQEQLAKAVQALPQKQDITNLFNKIDIEIKSLHQTIDNEIKNLAALNSDSGNNIYNTKINLDTFSTVGISKFLGCQLQSDGAMAGFDATQDNLYGWIFDVPKWDGAKTYEQIVYISDYGQGSLTYVRTKADVTSKEDFLKIANDRDLNKLGQIKQISVNGDTTISPDDDGVAKLKVVTKVNNSAPDSNGNVNVDSYSRAESDKRHNDLISRIEIQENKEIVHQCDDLNSGIAYSKAHPNVFVATP